MFALKIGISILSALVILQTALSFIRTSAWWVRMFDFPRAQIAFFSTGLLLLLGLTNIGLDRPGVWDWALFLFLSAAVAVQVGQMLPYTRFWKVQVPGVRRDASGAGVNCNIRILISNVLMTNRDFDCWSRVVREENPDLVIAVEADEWWDDRLRVFEADYPHHVRQPQDNTYGMVVFSRLPLEHTKIEHLVECDVPSIFTSVRLRSGEQVRLVVLHPRPPRPDIQQDSDLRDAELVLAGRRMRSVKNPVIIAGDLNDVAWSHTTRLFQRIAHVLDPRIGRGRFSTYPAKRWYLRFPLDHVFHSAHFDVVELRRLGHVGSDHFPMLIDLALRSNNEKCDKPSDTDAEDENEASDRVAEVRERQQRETKSEHLERKNADK